MSELKLSNGTASVVRLRQAAALVLIAVSAGCSPVTGYVERAVERELEQAVGPADSYDVDVRGLRARSGEAEHVRVVGVRVRPDGVPTLDLLEMDLRGVAFDRDAQRLERVDTVTANVHILADDVAAFLEEHRNLRDVEVRLDPPDQATIRARPELGALRLPSGVVLEIRGSLNSEAGTARYEVERVRAIGFDVGGEVASRLSAMLNPIVDLSEIPADLQVVDVRVAEGRILVDAAGRLVPE